MHQLTLVSVLAAALAINGLAFAAKAVNPNNATTTVQQTTTQILVYSAADSTNIIDRVSPEAPLVPFYQKGNWIKVGIPHDGKVGWVNKEQVKQAREAFFRPDIQTVYINVDHNKKGKPTLNIIAYKNGKKLEQKEADALYQRLRKQQEEQLAEMRRMDMDMENLFDQGVHIAHQMLGDGFFAPFPAPWLTQQRPMVVITNHAHDKPSESKNHSHHNTSSRHKTS